MEFYSLRQLERELDRAQEVLSLGIPQQYLSEFANFSPKSQENIINYLRAEKEQIKQNSIQNLFA